MSWQIELKEYIARCLKLGFSEKEIRAALRSVGWREADIEDGFSTAFSVIPASSDVIPARFAKASARRAKAGIQDINKIKNQEIKAPNLLLPSPSGKFPAAVKT